MRTIKQIRRDNLQYLVRTRYNSVPNRLAKDAGVHQIQISRVLAEGPSRRELGDKLARAIEEGAGLERGWLDQEHAAAEQIISKISNLSAEQKQAIEGLVDQLLATADKSTD